ncbi:LysR family transcriptional regulator [Sulfuriroseicoccus oceanibius]|uniref:LysR family transcriptional regulator n=1 Tax=Sulfuriroseicoccus oceanibius TaxID=2707525 RepID=A0A6B3LDL8_9BACT|nr:LysR family transcriptional regulator [Sulfuriroseicoccus oceanibius]QQL45683.1 LysR family transcriptional regulator [Sulfuriroseicoccus oceanibius]
MELRQLQYFVAVAELGGISAAARQANITQPALSRQIKALEDELGVALLERGARSISLTAAGELMADEAKRILNACESLAYRVQVAGRQVCLRVGYAPSLAAPYLGPALEKFQQLHPHARFTLSDLSSAEMRDRLIAGDLDVIISVPSDLKDAEVAWTKLDEPEWAVAVPVGHALAKVGAVKPEDLSGERVLMFDRHEYPEYWDSVSGYFRKHGINAKVAGEFDSVTSLGAALEAGLGLALIAKASRIGESDRVKVVSVSPAPSGICTAVGVSAKRELADAVREFVKLLGS